MPAPTAIEATRMASTAACRAGSEGTRAGGCRLAVPRVCPTRETSHRLRLALYITRVVDQAATTMLWWVRRGTMDPLDVVFVVFGFKITLALLITIIGGA